MAGGGVETAVVVDGEETVVVADSEQGIVKVAERPGRVRSQHLQQVRVALFGDLHQNQGQRWRSRNY